MKTIVLEGVEYELVPVYETVKHTTWVTPDTISTVEENVLKYYGLKPIEVTNQSLS